MAAMGALTSDMVNYLIWRYLQESGFSHATFSFQDDAHAEELEGQFGSMVGVGGLIYILQKGILYLNLEATEKQLDESIIKYPFYGASPDKVRDKSGKHRKSLSGGDGDVLMKSADGGGEADDVPAATNAVAAMAIGNNPVQPVESDHPALARHEREGSAQSQSKRIRDDVASTGVGKGAYPGSTPPGKRRKTGDGETSSAPAVNGVLEPDTQSEEVRATLGASIGTQVDDIIELNTTSEHIIDLAGKGDSEANEFSTACAFNPRDKRLLASAFRSGRLFSIMEDGTVSNNELQPSRTAEILEIVWSPSGKTFAAGMSSGEINVYDDEGSLRCRFAEQRAPILTLKYHRSKNLLLSVDAEGNAVIWNVKDHSYVYHWKLNKIPEILDADWVEEENFVVAGKNGTVQKYGFPTTELKLKFEGHDPTADVATIKWGEIDNLFATGSDDKNIILWDTNKSSPSAVLSGHSASVNRLQWCQPTEQNGNRHLLASASEDCNIRVWDVTSRTCLHVLELGEAPVHGLSFSPNGKYIAGGTDNATALIYEVNSGHLVCAYNGQKIKPQENGVKENGDITSQLIDGITWDCNSERFAFAVHGHQCIVINWKKLLDSAPERPSKHPLK